MDEAESLQAESKAYRFNPDNIAPPEVQQRLWALLKWRDGVFRGVSEKIESIPGLETLIDSLTDALNACTSWFFCAHHCVIDLYGSQMFTLSWLHGSR